jgi:DNA-binding transcriptional MocR family regulator
MSLAAVRLRMSESLIDQLAACEVLDRMDGPTGLLARRRVELAGARDLLVGALRARLPQWQIPTPPAGLVLWCGLPARYSSALAIAADRHGLRLVAGPRFGVTAGALDDRLRIPFTLPPDELRRAADALADADSTVARAQRPSEQPATAVVV